MEQSLQSEEQITDKDKILELRKSQLYKKWHTEDNIKKIKSSKKPFPKFGFILIIYSIISMVVAEYGPWLYLKTKYISGYEIEDFVFKNFRGADPKALLYYKEPASYIHGIHEEYFYDIPALINYALITIFAIGIIITVYGIIDRKKNYEVIQFREKQSYLYLLIIPPCILIIISCIPVISSYLILGHNAGGFLEYILKNINQIESVPLCTPPVPYFLVISTFFIITIGLTVIDSNLRIVKDEIKSSKEKMLEKTRIIPNIKRFDR